MPEVELSEEISVIMSTLREQINLSGAIIDEGSIVQRLAQRIKMRAAAARGVRGSVQVRVIGGPMNGRELMVSDCASRYSVPVQGGGTFDYRLYLETLTAVPVGADVWRDGQGRICCKMPEGDK